MFSFPCPSTKSKREKREEREREREKERERLVGRERVTNLPQKKILGRRKGEGKGRVPLRSGIFSSVTIWRETRALSSSLQSLTPRSVVRPYFQTEKG